MRVVGTLCRRAMVAVTAAVAAMGAGAADAESTKLNPPLVPGGSVGAFAISADASRVVYRAVQNTPGVNEVFGMPTAGGQAARINGSFVAGGTVPNTAGSFAISPDSARVVYIADQDVAGQIELYSASIGGGNVTKLSGPMTPGGDVSTFPRISPDGSRVVYLADQDIDGVVELYSVPIAGGQVVKLNPAYAPGQTVLSCILSPDGTRVIYFAKQDSTTAFELYSVPITGGTSVKLSPPLNGAANITAFNVTANSARAVFTVAPDTNTGSMVKLYSTPLGGGQPTLLSENVIPPGTLLFVVTFVLSPDGNRVIYTAANGGTWLFSQPVAGGSPDKLNDDPRTQGAVTSTVAVVSPDSSQVVFPANGELYVTPIGSGTVTKLSGPMVAGGNVSIGFSFDISPNGSRLVYRADQDTDGRTELYSVPLAGGAITKLSGPLVNGGNVTGFVFTPDSARVVYRADQTTDGVFELFGVPIAGGDASRLNSPVIAGGTVSTIFSATSDSQRVVYLANQDTPGVQELYSAPLIGAPTTVVAAVLPASRSVLVGSPATIFATMINAGIATGQSCGIALGPGVAADFLFQTTDPQTNALIGTPNTPVDIGVGGNQSFVLQVTPTAPTPPVDVAFAFQCANSAAATVVVGLNTLLLSAATTPLPDVIALAGTTSGDGIVNIPGPNGTGVFAVATSNVGAGSSITVTADTGAAASSPGLAAPEAVLPIFMGLCQTDPQTAACVNPPVPALSVVLTIGPGETPTFSVFVQGQGTVPFDPADNRVFVRFKDGDGITRGATSVAVRTQ